MVESHNPFTIDVVHCILLFRLEAKRKRIPHIVYVYQMLRVRVYVCVYAPERPNRATQSRSKVQNLQICVAQCTHTQNIIDIFKLINIQQY